MIGHILLGPYLTASQIGYAAGTAISILLLALTSRAVKLPGTPAANILFAACSLVWNLGGLAGAAAVTLGAPTGEAMARILLAFQFTGAAVWPISLLAIWSPLAALPNQRRNLRALQILAVLSCAVIVILFWSGVYENASREVFIARKDATACSQTILMALGMLLFRDRLASRSLRLPTLAILVGVFGNLLSVVLMAAFPSNPVFCTVLRVIAEQITLLIVLGAFFLFTRFRFSDLFIRYSLRVLLAAFAAIGFLLLQKVPFLATAGFDVPFPDAAQALVETITAAALLFAFVFVDGYIAACVDRWIFHAPDYPELLRQFSDRLSTIHSEHESVEITEQAVRDALELKDTRLISLEELPAFRWPEAILAGEIVEVDTQDPLRAQLPLANVELLVPVRTSGRVSHVLEVAPGSERRGLVSHEVNYLRSVAAQFGQWLDVLRIEEQMVERQNREAVLLQQITEAELRALRAQINPHFLFNSLNSIANLIVTNPDRAETMTLQLARVFRHVLANSARPLIPLCKEVEFLRTYLLIEEARFGSRLAVSIEIDPSIARENIPTLILQPVVENALKHGLGPKPGQGHLWITAEPQGDRMQLRVEDDGLGPGFGVQQNGNGERSNGVGLENIAQRLSALYKEQGRINLEPRQGGGTRVTILLPREDGAIAS
jgi:two-component system, LytTR family, sensor kinase